MVSHSRDRKPVLRLMAEIPGVLTKVDRIEPGTSAKWVNILKNKENSLKNGWYCVKQPNARELEAGISWEEARDSEDTFFRLTEPWASIALPHRKRMGSGGLTDHLSTLLSDLVFQKSVFGISFQPLFSNQSIYDL